MNHSISNKDGNKMTDKVNNVSILQETEIWKWKKKIQRLNECLQPSLYILLIFQFSPFHSHDSENRPVVSSPYKYRGT